MKKILKINEKDNVVITLEDIKAGDVIETDRKSIYVKENIAVGHKLAIKKMNKGDKVIKYGFPIGHATKEINEGEWVHTHNIKTNLSEILDYTYNPIDISFKKEKSELAFKGFKRDDGQIGIRNEIWIIPTVGCVNKSAKLIAEAIKGMFDSDIDGVYHFEHPYGCSQLGEDHENTQKILKNMVKHPNAGAVLVLGLGCENNNVEEFKKLLGDYDSDRVKFLISQEVEDEVEEGIRIVTEELSRYAKRFRREEVSVSELKVGLKCGGSDAFSGITANPLVGAFSDRLVKWGGTTVLTEVPEMFGAETILMNRAVNEQIFRKIVKLINDFKNYFLEYDQPIYENPSPGNKKGGITTLEEKSLGCTQKGGTTPVVDVLEYGDLLKAKGLNLLQGPGNDLVASTVLAAAGCQMVLFTTGRGTPFGTFVPTVKISSNTRLFNNKQNWMDFNAGVLTEGISMEQLVEEFISYLLKVASGEIKTKNEIRGYREIAIFKHGVTL
ncbi:Altronate dehydratase [Koleobacter methoxysyntrophicus]|jgi:altronate hydrolase|uniref:Altronate dehydratase n=1 Tax=Koleobacter methoxysyntrophicus TaxID=2751313 RepID=A0A8A0RJQ2_9FIRM|nr:altronate dehydratase family protein [Koleobacter methoxysyntrophicus]QSQ08671.1 Altronate dehydratase [Koleobacter methoxysyntrophicus]